MSETVDRIVIQAGTSVMTFTRREEERASDPDPVTEEAPERVAPEVCSAEYWRNLRAQWRAWIERTGRQFLATWEPLPVEPELTESLWVAAPCDGSMFGTGATPRDAIVSANAWNLATWGDAIRAADVGDDIPEPGRERNLMLEGDQLHLVRITGSRAALAAIAKRGLIP